MSPEAELVWQASEDYLALALKHLGLQKAGREPLATAKEQYRVSFLFPNLPERSRRDLCKVRCRFVGVDETRQRQRRENAQTVSPGFEYQESDALQFQKEAEDALFGFTRIQQEILRDKFLVQLKS